MPATDNTVLKTLVCLDFEDKNNLLVNKVEDEFVKDVVIKTNNSSIKYAALKVKENGVQTQKGSLMLQRTSGATVSLTISKVPILTSQKTFAMNLKFMGNSTGSGDFQLIHIGIFNKTADTKNIVYTELDLSRRIRYLYYGDTTSPGNPNNNKYYSKSNFTWKTLNNIYMEIVDTTYNFYLNGKKLDTKKLPFSIAGANKNKFARTIWDMSQEYNNFTVVFSMYDSPGANTSVKKYFYIDELRISQVSQDPVINEPYEPEEPKPEEKPIQKSFYLIKVY